MGLFAARKNFGFGKQISWAGKLALRVDFCDGHYSTVAKHTSSWRQFCFWLDANYGVGDARKITQEQLEEYAKAQAERVLDEEVAISTAQNLLSGANITLQALRGDCKVRIDSPSAWVGHRPASRVDPPSGNDRDQVADAVQLLMQADLPRPALIVQLCRNFGIRLREAILGEVDEWRASVACHRAINVTRGTKGGRGKTVDRWVPCPDEGYELLETASDQMNLLGCGSNLLLPSETYKEFIESGELVRARRLMCDAGIKCFRDLRSAWACEWYFRDTGCFAPVFRADERASLSVDKAARRSLSYMLGHGRLAIVANYIGAAR